MSYAPAAILFDGTTDFMKRNADLTGIVDGKLGTLNLWFRIDGGDNTARSLFVNDTGGIRLEFTSLNELILTARSSLEQVLDLTHNLNFQAGTNWFHYVASWDVGAGTAHAYLDDALKASEATFDNDIEYTQIDWVLGGRLFFGVDKFPGAISDFYFTTEFLDLDIVSNRRKFIDANGDPVFLGDNGELPTGTAALVYLRGNETDQGLNAGTGGDFVSQGTQVPGETPGPVVLVDAEDAMRHISRRTGRFHRFFRG